MLNYIVLIIMVIIILAIGYLREMSIIINVILSVKIKGIVSGYTQIVKLSDMSFG